jgi:hypothetical protein
MNVALTFRRSAPSGPLPWLVAGAWVAWQLATRDSGVTWGWDESMHAELPAARLALYLRAGDLAGAFDAIHSCTQYPFVWPTILGITQAAFGLSEAAARVAGVVLFGLTMVGAFQLTRSVASRLALGERESRFAAWGALAACAASPLAGAYAGTLFHAVPFACVSTWTLIAWSHRDPERPLSDVLAGAVFAIAFFTKFNYAVLLGAILTADFLFEWLFVARPAGLARQMWGRGLRLALPVVTLCCWWFFLPLPGGSELAAVHRDAFMGFLQGNLEVDYLSPARRLVEWGAGLHAHPRLLLLVVSGVILGMRTVRKPGGHLLGAATLVPFAAICAHPFHLDRFLVPFAPALWSFAAIGLTTWLWRDGGLRRMASLLALLCIVPLGGVDSRALADAVGLVPPAGAQRDYVYSELERLGQLGEGRRVPTAGLGRESAEAMLDAIAGAVAPMERVGWLGISSELSPAALHLGLLERGGEEERFLRDAHREVDVTFFGVDPSWSDERLREWASSYEVILMTDPPDLGGRRAREFMRAYQERLLGLGWEATFLGNYEWQGAAGELRSVQLFASRSSQ